MFYANILDLKMPFSSPNLLNLDAQFRCEIIMALAINGKVLYFCGMFLSSADIHVVTCKSVEGIHLISPHTFPK